MFVPFRAEVMKNNDTIRDRESCFGSLLKPTLFHFVYDILSFDLHSLRLAALKRNAFIISKFHCKRYEAE